MSKTRIVVLHLKEIIYTIIFVGLGILLILLLVFMFLPKDNDSTATNAPKYKAGVYTSQMVLNNATLNLEVVVDEDHINSVRFVNLDETVSAMYPLVEPAINDIAAQLLDDIDIKEIRISEDSKYTETHILNTIESTLKKAAPN